jgi:hypothetical protein
MTLLSLYNCIQTYFIVIVVGERIFNHFSLTVYSSVTRELMHIKCESPVSVAVCFYYNMVIQTHLKNNTYHKVNFIVGQSLQI